jgi:ketosteroid isomerase-like protein
VRAVKAIALLILVACGSEAGSVRTFAPMDRTSIVGVIEAQAAAWNRGDLDGYMAGYAKIDQLVFTSGAKVRRGYQATYDAFHTKYAQDRSKMGKLAFEILEVQPIGADGAVVLGNWKLTGSPSDGSGVFSVVVERRPEGWRVVHDHTSAATP